MRSLRGSEMKRSAHRVRFVFVAIIASLCVAPAFPAQTPDELDWTARARIEQACSSIVIVRAENESNQKFLRQSVPSFVAISSPLTSSRLTKVRALASPRQNKARSECCHMETIFSLMFYWRSNPRLHFAPGRQRRSR